MDSNCIRGSVAANLYAVIKFIVTKTIAVVPIKWLSHEEDKCFWPPSNSKDYKRVSKLAKELVHQKEHWKEYTIRILGKASE